MNTRDMTLHDIEREGYRMYKSAGKDKEKWIKCTDCFLYLIENSKSPRKKAQYGNTLGYIFYYGRTNDFKPEYDKAFKYFSIGAEGGFFESIYKLGDMYLNGYFVEKDPQMAVKLYTQVYEQVERQFREEEFGGVFADISLRLGNLYRKGIGCKKDAHKALFIFTMADYAIKERMRDSDFFGNQKVLDSITKELTELSEELGVDTGKKEISADYPQVLPLVLSEGYAGRVFFKKEASGIAISMHRSLNCDSSDYVLPRVPVIFSEYGYLRFFNVICEHAKGVKELKIMEEGFNMDEDSLPVDEIRYDSANESYEFCHEGTIRAYIRAEKFVFELVRE